MDATLELPGSKSLTNRALLIAALAAGESQLSGALFAEDTEAMMDAVVGLGASLVVSADRATLTIAGRDGAAPEGRIDIDARQSGTTSRFLLPALAACSGEWLLDGADQLRARPFGDQLDALRQVGADIDELGSEGHLPLRIRGGQLTGNLVTIAGNVSSQFLSGLLIVGPLTREGLTIELTTDLVSRSYVDLTVAVMRAFGAQIVENERTWHVAPTGYTGTSYAIEPDASAASYFFGAAAVTGGRCRVRGLGSGALQGDTGFVDVLASMGADVVRTADWTEVTVSQPLAGVKVNMSQISDTAQTLAVVAATASSETEVTGVGFIQAKETRRIDAVVTELNRVGVEAQGRPDGFVVIPGPISEASIRTYDDHRMAMSFALLGLITEGIEIENPDCVNKTFPDFWEVLESLRPSRRYPKVVALDGPAGSGKSTVATELAHELGIVHFDTGAMYRAVAYAVLDRGVDPGDAPAVAEVARSAVIELGDHVRVDGVDVTEAIRSAEVTAVVSATSAVPDVRSELVGLQRRWAMEQDGSVLDGRDIGTVVFPDAAVKVYLTARVDVRAARRFAQTTGRSLEEISDDIERRDLADSSRATSPLRAADDAIMIDTSDRSVADIVSELAILVRRTWSDIEEDLDG